MFALIIPCIVLFFWYLLNIATGPYWQFPDPSYGYLSSSLSLIKGFSPTFNYQPGMSIEILGAFVILLLNTGHSSIYAIHQAILFPDFYLHAINDTMMVFVLLTSFILGTYVYRQTKDMLASLLSQLPILGVLSLKSYSFYNYVLPVISNVSPEPLLIGICCLFNLCILKLFFAKHKNEEITLSLLLGFLCGLGVATRLTFVPDLILPLVLCRGRMKLLFIAVSAISFVLCTIPIIPLYPWIWHWIVNLSTHTERYGAGDSGFIKINEFLWNFKYILSICSPLSVFAIGALLFNLGQGIWKGVSRENYFLLATAFCILAQFALVAKHYDDHYLVPAITLFSPFFVLFYLNVKNKSPFFKFCIILCMLIFTVQSLERTLAYNKKLSRHTKETVSFSNMLHTKYPDVIFIGTFPMPMSTPEAAFFWGNDRDKGSEDDLSALYPQHYAYFSDNVNDYGPYVSGIYSIKQRVWADNLIANGSHVMFVAPKGYDFSSTPYTVHLMEKGKYAAAYLLVNSTEKEANAIFDASFKLSEAGDYQQAVAFAMKSRELHYQPDEKITFLLYWLYPHVK